MPLTDTFEMHMSVCPGSQGQHFQDAESVSCIGPRFLLHLHEQAKGLHVGDKKKVLPLLHPLLPFSCAVRAGGLL